ncbi:uncharacterized protein LOC141915467 [Tubulanus polymorphus]|uniref:uncharacterized protein LOC141915467 n=1 Tax=Tubulanus polymorphus TaxID=672921 RepID=UPI003DA62E50
MILLELPEVALRECLQSLRYHLDLLDELVISADEGTWNRWSSKRRQPEESRKDVDKGNSKVKPIMVHEVEDSVSGCSGNDDDIGGSENEDSTSGMPKIANTYSILEGSVFLPNPSIQEETKKSSENPPTQDKNKKEDIIPKGKMCSNAENSSNMNSVTVDSDIDVENESNSTSETVLQPPPVAKDRECTFVEVKRERMSPIPSASRDTPSSSTPSPAVSSVKEEQLSPSSSSSGKYQHYGLSPRPFRKNQIIPPQSLYNPTAAGPRGKLPNYFMPKPFVNRDGTVLNKCHICLNIYPSHQKLARHLRRHAGVRPFRCHLCGKCFFQVCDLKRHRTGVHAEDAPFHCGQCGKVYAYPTDLRQHVKSHFKSNDIKVENEDSKVGLLEAIQKVVKHEETADREAGIPNKVRIIAIKRTNAQAADVTTVQKLPVSEESTSTNNMGISTTNAGQTALLASVNNQKSILLNKPKTYAIVNNSSGVSRPLAILTPTPSSKQNISLPETHQCNSQPVFNQGNSAFSHSNLTYIRHPASQNYRNDNNAAQVRPPTYLFQPQVAPVRIVQSNMNVTAPAFQPVRYQSLITGAVNQSLPLSQPSIPRPPPLQRFGSVSSLNVHHNIGHASTHLSLPPPPMQTAPAALRAASSEATITNTRLHDNAPVNSGPHKIYEEHVETGETYEILQLD